MIFFSKSTTKQSLITKYTILGLIIGAVISGILFYTPTQQDTTDFYGKYVTAEVFDKSKIDIHDGCKISRFGMYPWSAPGKERDSHWESNTVAALKLMSIPSEIIPSVIAKLRNGKPDDVVGFGNTNGIAAVEYLPNYITTYKSNGKSVVCLNSSTNFSVSTRREYAKLYIFQHEGKEYHIGEFLACGNVSRFFPGSTGPKLLNNDTKINNVPEPSSAFLVIIALIILIYFKVRKS